MIFDCTDPELVVHINKFANRLRKEGLRVFQLGFFNSKVEGSFPFPIFNKKELNWYGKPNSANVEEFLERNLDILINAYTVPNSPLEFISKTSGANFRAGIFNENLCDCNDFMISKADGSYELPEGLNSLYSYIKSINGKRA